jgi:hypothetical protein
MGALMVYILCVDLMGDRRDRRWLLRVLLLSATVPLALGFYQYFTDTGDHGTSGLNRIMGTFVYPSQYGFYLVQLLPLALVIFVHTTSRLARVGLVVLTPAIVFSIYATQTARRVDRARRHDHCLPVGACALDDDLRAARVGCDVLRAAECAGARLGDQLGTLRECLVLSVVGLVAAEAVGGSAARRVAA